MNRVQTLSALFVLLGGYAALHCSPWARAAETNTARPNILFAIADDWSVHAGVYGTPWVKTPAFDRVAREGLLFRNAYTPMAKCAPSRAIVLTGRHLWQNEQAGNHMAHFPAKLKSWPEVLMERGWHVGITGKGWGPGIANDADGNPRRITGVPYNRHKATPPARAISNNDYAANFAEFLDAAPQDAPWCFWYGATEPHRGYEFQVGVNKGGKRLEDIDRVPAYWPDHEIVRHDMLDYAFEVEHVDNHLARMIAELEQRGLLNDTLIIVTSDHGMPFPRVKGYAYHDSNHVPLALRWPGGVNAPGRVIDDFVDFTDIAPTILDLAGIAAGSSGMQPITGRSWREILESDQAGRIVPERDHVLIGKERTDVGRPHDWGYPIRGIVTATDLYLRNYEPTRWPAGNPETGYLDTDGSPTKSLILERGRQDRADRFWQLNFGMRPVEELYDLTADADCVQNLAADPAYAERVRMLRARMEAALRSQDDPRMFGLGHVFDEYKPTGGAGFYERFHRGEKPPAGWVNETDFEKQAIPQPDGSSPGVPGEDRSSLDTPRSPGPVMDAAAIRAGLKTHDRALYIKAGWIRDPYIVLAPDGFYYLTGTTPNPNDPREAADPYNTGLGPGSIVGYHMQLWRSNDLIEWEYLGTPFSLLDGYWAKQQPDAFQGDRIRWHLWAPEVHFFDGRWHIVHTTPSPVQRGSNLAVTAGAEIQGPYSFPLGELSKGRHDPSLFRDDDGTVYLLWQNTMIAPLSKDLARFTAEPVRIDPAGSRPGPDGQPISRIGHEGATMHKIGGKYVHFGTAWSTDRGRRGSYNLYYCTADKITGPYGPRQFAGRFLGHGTPFQDKDGKWWCTAFFNANVPPLPREGIETRDLGDDAQTINEQGVTIVPLDVRLLSDGQVFIRAKDPAYANPGPDEVQKF
jgi:N-sulfoglucosamine sulfohydrolase